jgi:transcription factor E2F7/8
MKSPLHPSSKANMVLAEIQPDLGPLTTPTKPKEVSQGEPWTPTANLKMLISAVSPEIRSRDQKRGLSDNRSALPEARDCLHVGLQGGWVAFGGLWMKGRSVWSPELLEGC